LFYYYLIQDDTEDSYNQIKDEGTTNFICQLTKWDI